MQMDFTAVAAGAVEGGAKAAGEVVAGRIDKQNRIDFAREFSAIDEQKQLRIAEAADLRQRDSMMWQTTGDFAAAKLEQERKSGEQQTGILRNRAETLAPVQIQTAGAIARAEDDARSIVTSPGQKVSRGGQTVAENKGLTAAEAQLQLYREGLKTSGSSAKADAWFKYRDAPDSLVSTTNEMTGRPEKSVGLERVFSNTYAMLRQHGVRQPGDIEAPEAHEQASAFTMKLRQKAEARLASARRDDPKSQLTLEQAVAGVYQETKAALRAKESAEDNPESSLVPIGTRSGVPAPVPAPAPSSRRGLLMDPLDAAGQRLDAARTAAIAANQALLRFGSRQRAADPRGFQKAQEAAEAAAEQRLQAERDYTALAGPAAVALPGRTQRGILRLSSTEGD